MYPVLVELGRFPVYTYGVLLAAAYLLGLLLAVRRAEARGLDGARVTDLGIWIIASALVGAKLLMLVVEYDYYRRNPGELLSIVRSGGVFYGGLLLAVPVAVWYVRRHALPVWVTGDAIATGIALGQIVGRMGCLMAGCCYGREAHVPWAITFTNPLAAEYVGTPLDVPLHPTQIYEAVAVLAILVVLLATERRWRPFAGRTFWLYILLYSAARFAIEFFRGDPRGAVGPLSTSQFIAVLLVPVSLYMLFRLARAPRDPLPRAAARRTRAA